MNDVSRWLNEGAGVPEGLRLLSLYGHTHLARLVSAQPARWAQLMRDTLSQYADDTPVPPADTPQPALREHSARSGPRFRERWPFLSEPDCPMELKALAADKITAYENYTRLHEELYDCGTTDECYEKAKKLLENFEQNRIITAEFSFYAEHRSVLGKHPIFAEQKRINRYRSLSVYQLAQEKVRLEKSIWKSRAQLRRGDRPDLETDRRRALAAKERELETVMGLIGEAEKGR